MDLGLATYGERYLDREIYNYLKSEGELLESLTPLIIKERYLKNNDYIETKNYTMHC